MEIKLPLICTREAATIRSRMMTWHYIRLARQGLLGLALGCGMAAGAKAGELVSGETRSGEIVASAASNVYVFSGQAGDRVKVRMTEIDPDIGPYLKLLDPQGKCFAYADSDCCRYRAAQINVTLRSDGPHTIVCKDRQDATGRYTISMVCLPGCPLSKSDTDIGDVGIGQTVAGAIDCAGDLDIAFFTAEPGTHLLIRMERLDPALDPGLQLYDADGKCLASAEKRNPRATSEIDVTLTAGGMYTLICQDRYVNTGSYTLAILPVSDGPFLLSGESVTGAVVPEQPSPDQR